MPTSQVVLNGIIYSLRLHVIISVQVNKHLLHICTHIHYWWTSDKPRIV